MKKPSLDTLLDKIDPKNNIDYYYRILDEILNTYKYPNKTPNNDEEVERLFHDFVYYAAFKFQRKNPPINATETDKKWHFEGYYNIYKAQTVRDLLFDEIELRKAHTEGAGGLYRYFQKIGQAMAEIEIMLTIYGEVSGFFYDDCSNNTKIISSLCQEYGKRFGHMLPPSWLEDNCMYIKLRFLEVFQYHPFIVKWLRGTGDLRCQSVLDIFGGRLKALIRPQYR